MWRITHQFLSTSTQKWPTPLPFTSQGQNDHMRCPSSEAGEVQPSYLKEGKQEYWEAALVASTPALLPNMRSFVIVWFSIFETPAVSGVVSRRLGVRVLERNYLVKHQSGHACPTYSLT